MQTTSSINASTLIKISSGDIKLGMFMSEPDRPWLETPFLFQGLLLDNEDILQQVRKECQFIFIDKEKSSIKQEVKAQKTALPSVSTRVVNSKPMEQEFNNAFIKHQEARTEVKQVLSRMKVGEGINVTKIRSSVKTCVSSIMANPNAMLWLTKLRNRDDYIAEHCLNVGVLAIFGAPGTSGSASPSPSASI